jgi:hypothetical protein
MYPNFSSHFPSSMVCRSGTTCGPSQTFVADKNLLSAKIYVVTAYRQKNMLSYVTCVPARGGIVVNPLRYKPEGRKFDSQWCHWNFSLT